MDKEQENLEQFTDIDFGEPEPKPGPDLNAPVETVDYTQRALDMGWIPPEQFKGDISKHISAEEFVKRGENFMPILKANNRKLEERNKKLYSDLEEVKKGVEAFRKYHEEDRERAIKHGYEQAMKEFKAKQREAYEDGDLDKVEEIEKQKEQETHKYYEKMSKPVTAPEENKQDNQKQYPEAVKQFLDSNPWYHENSEMRAYAQAMEGYITSTNPNIKGDDPQLYQKITDMVKAQFPDKFENPRRNNAGAVEGSTTTTTVPAGKTFADLPPEMKEQFKELKKIGYTQEQFVKEYFNFQDTGIQYFD